MLGRLIVLIALVGAVVWFLRWFRNTPPARVAKMLRRSLLWGTGGALVLLAVSGRLPPLFAALPAVVPVVIRVLSLLRLLPMIRQTMHSLGLSGRSGTTAGSGGQTSLIRTCLLEMILDHASGEMDGLVLEGPLRGHRLSALDLEQLVELLILCRSADNLSAAVLEAYLDRVRGGDWRECVGGGAEAASPVADTALTPEEALAILGLTQGASKYEIRAAHRRLMQRFHPDRGGSDYLAAKINAAKRLLLDE